MSDERCVHERWFRHDFFFDDIGKAVLHLVRLLGVLAHHSFLPERWSFLRLPSFFFSLFSRLLSPRMVFAFSSSREYGRSSSSSSWRMRVRFMWAPACVQVKTAHIRFVIRVICVIRSRGRIRNSDDRAPRWQLRAMTKDAADAWQRVALRIDARFTRLSLPKDVRRSRDRRAPEHNVYTPAWRRKAEGFRLSSAR